MHVWCIMAKILISGVVKEEEISLPEVLKILEESKENISSNKVLQEKSAELIDLTSQLKDANDAVSPSPNTPVGK